MFQCVYSIQCLDENVKEFYIGSTDDLQQRIRDHHFNYKRYPNRKVYKFIRENGGWDNWEINFIQKFKFLTDDELRIYEQWYLDTYKPELNSKRAFVTKQQKIIDSRNNANEYYKKNKEKINYNRKNKKANCPHCNIEMRKDSIKGHIKTKHTNCT